MNWAAILWLLVMLAFIAVEAATVTMVSTWFAVGALAAMICAMLSTPVWFQIVVFLVMSTALLLFLRNVAKKYFIPKLTKTNVDSVIGSTGLVTVQIDNVNAAGQVKLGAMEWTARSTTGDVIPVGAQIRVDRIEGVKVYVTPVQVPVA